MNFLEACRLLDKFGGSIATGSSAHIIVNKYNYLAEYGDDEDSKDFPIYIKWISSSNWLYYNNKLKCLCCEKCCKLFLVYSLSLGGDSCHCDMVERSTPPRDW